MANFGMILELSPTWAAVNDTVYVETIGGSSGPAGAPMEEIPGIHFSNSIMVRAYPDTPALRNLIMGTGGSTGAVVIMINDVTIHSPNRLSFKVPFDMLHIARLMHVSGFLIQVWHAGNWAWTYAALEVVGSSSPAFRPSFYGNLGSVLNVSPINCGVGDTVTIEIPVQTQQMIAFSGYVEVRLFAEDPALFPLIAGSGTITGHVHIKVPSVSVLNQSKLTFVVPQDVTRFIPITSFYIQVDTIYSAAWSTQSIKIGRSVATTLPGVVIGGHPTTIEQLIINPDHGYPDDRIAITYVGTLFNLDSAQNVWLEEDIGGTFGANPFAYRLSFQRMAPNRLEARLPHTGDPSLGFPAAGSYRLKVYNGQKTVQSTNLLQLQESTASSNPSTPTANPGIILPTPTSSTAPRFSPRAPVSISAGNSSIAISTGSPGTATTSGEERETPPYEEFVQWVVEQSWPILDDPDDILKFRFIVSLQLFRNPFVTVSDEKVRINLIEDGLTKFELLAVGNTVNAVLQENGKTETRTNSEGYAYCLMEVEMIRQDDITNQDDSLLPIMAVFGDANSTVTASASPSPNPSTIVSSVSTAGIEPAMVRQQNGGGIVDNLINILVGNNEPAVILPIEYIDNLRRCVAGITRVKEEIIKFSLDMVALYMKSKYPIPNNFQFNYSNPYTGYTDSFAINLSDDDIKGIHLGFLMGETRGLYVAARDTITDFLDLAEMSWTLIKKLYEKIAEDPVFAAKVILIMKVPPAGRVLYELDDGFKTKVDNFIIKTTMTAAKAIEFMKQMAAVVWKARTKFGAIGRILYKKGKDGFDKLVGFVPIDYLGFPKDSRPYNMFMGAFIAADILAFIVGTVGIEVLLGLLTSGIYNVISTVAKAGKISKVAKLAQLILKILDSASAGIAFAKKGAGKTMAAMFNLLGTIHDNLILRLINVAEDKTAKMVKLLFKYIDTPDPQDGVKLISGIIKWMKRYPNNSKLDDIVKVFDKELDYASGLNRSGQEVIPDGFKCSCIRAKAVID